MGRTRLVRSTNGKFDKQIALAKEKKRRFIDELQKLKDKYSEREITYSNYLRRINQKKNGRNLYEWIHYYEKNISNLQEKAKKERRIELVSATFLVVLAVISLSILILNLPMNKELLFSPDQEFSQELNLQFEEDGVYNLEIEQEGILNFASISGSIEGAGNVKVYLDELLILDSSNVVEKNQIDSEEILFSPEESASKGRLNVIKEIYFLKKSINIKENYFSEYYLFNILSTVIKNIDNKKILFSPEDEIPQESVVEDEPQQEESIEESNSEQNEEIPETEEESSPSQEEESSPASESEEEISEETENEETSSQNESYSDNQIEEDFTEESSPSQESSSISEINESVVVKNDSEENVVPKEKEFGKNESVVVKKETEGENKSETVKEFLDYCEETCELSNLGLNKSSYTLRVEIENVELKIETIKYSITKSIEVSLPTTNLTQNISNTNATINTSHSFIRIGEPVKWKKTVVVNETGPVTVKLPKLAENITIKKIKEFEEEIISKKIEKEIQEHSEQNEEIPETEEESSPSQEEESSPASESEEEISEETENEETSSQNESYSDNQIEEDFTEESSPSQESSSISETEQEENTEEIIEESNSEQNEEIPETEEESSPSQEEESSPASEEEVNFEINEEPLLSPEIEFNLLEKIFGFFKRLFGFREPLFSPEEFLGNETEEIELVINDNATEYEIQYETPGPEAFEENTSKGKIITISAPDILNYSNILAYTSLPEQTPSHTIRLYHYVGKDKIAVEIAKYDLDENGLVDYIEWLVPHLSNQTYELVIEIIKAEHLDENRTYVSDIYAEVSAKDNIWSEQISDGHYVRVTFAGQLDSSRDITIYARGNNRSSIDVYTEDGNESVATFDSINEENWYKIYLTELNGSFDIFDLKINGSVEFDFIIDPFPQMNTTRIEIDAGGNLKGYCNATDLEENPLYYEYNWYKGDKKYYTDSYSNYTGELIASLFYSNSTSLTDSYDVDVQEEYAYISGDAGFTIIDLTDIGSGYFKQIAHIENSTIKSSNLYVLGDYAYLTSYTENSLRIINISSKHFPVQVGYLVNDTSLDGAAGIKVQEDIAYIVSTNNKSLTIINISNKINPKQITNYPLDFAGLITKKDSYVRGDYVYYYGSGHFSIINVSNTSNPTLRSRLNNESFGASSKGIFIKEDSAYLPTSDSLYIVNISDFDNLEIIGNFSNSSSLNDIQEIYVAGNFVHIASKGRSAVVILDISNPRNILQTSFINSTNLLGVEGIDLSRGWVFVKPSTQPSLRAYEIATGFPQGLETNVDKITKSQTTNGDEWKLSCRAYDGQGYSDWMNSSSVVIGDSLIMNSVRISPINPTTSDNLLGFCNATEVDGDNISYFYEWYKDDQFYSEGSLGSRSGDAVQISSFSNTSLNDAYGIYVLGDYAYVASGGFNSLTIINISNHENLEQISVITNSSSLKGISEVFIKNNLAYTISPSNDSLTIINVSDPANPKQVSWTTNSSSLDGATAVYVSGDYAYVTSSNGATAYFTIINISDPINPKQVDFRTELQLNDPHSIYIQGDYAYVTGSSTSSLSIADISHPADLGMIYNFMNTSLNGAIDVYVQEDYAYVASLTSDSLTIINISNHVAPKQIGWITNSSSLNGAYGVYVSGDYAYVVSGINDSLTIINISDPKNPKQAYWITNSSSLNDAREIFIKENYAYVLSDIGTSGFLTVFEIGDGFSSGQEINIGSITSSQTTNGDEWKLSCRAYDGQGYSDWMNSSSVEIGEEETEATMISNCQSLNSANTLYQLDQSIENNTLNGNCINISAENITLDCNGHYITSEDNFTGVYSNQYNTTIKNCNISMGSGGNMESKGIKISDGASYSTIMNNILNDNSYGIVLKITSQSLIQDNIINNNNNYGISFEDSSEINIINNNLSLNLRGIFGSFSDSNYLVNNTVSSFWDNAINLFGCTETDLIDNTVFSGQNFGIYIYNNNNNCILKNNKGNSIFSAGIFLQEINNCTITDNAGTSNSSIGIYLSSSSNNTLVGNTGTSNSSIGIYLSSSSNNTLINNTGVSYSNRAIYLLSSSNNYFYNTKAEGRLAGSNGITLGISAHNLIQDCVNVSGVAEDILFLGLQGSINNTFINCSYDKSKENTGMFGELIRKWYYQAYVNDTTGADVSGADVSAYNVSGDLEFSGLITNSSGWTNRTTITEYVNLGGVRSYYSNYSLNTSHSNSPDVSYHTYNVSLNLNNLNDNFEMIKGYFIQELNKSLNITIVLIENTSENVEIYPQSGIKEVLVGIGENYSAILTINFTQDINLSNLTAGVNYLGRKSFIHGYNHPNILNASLLIPRVVKTEAVYICPGATSLAEVNPQCTNVTPIGNNMTSKGMSVSNLSIGGKEYYRVTNISSGGAEYEAEISVELNTPIDQSIVRTRSAIFNATAFHNLTFPMSVIFYAGNESDKLVAVSIQQNVQNGSNAFGEYFGVPSSPNYNNSMNIWMHFDNNSAYGENDTHIYDFSGKENNGTVYGNASFVSDGRFDKGLLFNSIGQQVIINNSESLDSKEFSLTTWIKPNELTPNRSQYIAGKGGLFDIQLNDSYLTSYFYKENLSFVDKYLSAFGGTGGEIHPADLDNDGLIDVLATKDDNEVGIYGLFWFRNLGNGSFSTPYYLTHWGLNFGYVRSAYPADMDKDGDLDIVFTDNHDSRGIMWIRNNNNCFFSGTDVCDKITIKSTDENPREVEAHDLDEDGYLDVIASIQSNNEILFFENTNQIGTSWSEKKIVSSFDASWGIEIADIDGDGHKDILGTARDSNLISWWKNNLTCIKVNNGCVQNNIPFYSPNFASIYDMDGDGDMDIVVSSNLGGNISWFENQNGAGTSWNEHSISTSQTGVWKVEGVDIDGDGDGDVISAIAGTIDEIVLWENKDGVGNSWERIKISDSIQANQAYYIEAQDIDKDGDMDLVTTNRLSSSYYYVYWNNRTSFANPLPITKNQWNHVALVANESEINLYVNGFNVSSQKQINFSKQTGQFYIGSYLNSYFNGTIDELVFYNRTLTKEEVLSTKRIAEGKYYWKANVSDGALTNNSEIREFTVQWTPPEIQLIYPEKETGTQPDINFNYTVLDYAYNLLLCNLTIDGKVNVSEIASVSGAYTNQTVTDFSQTKHNWSVTCWNMDNLNISETRNFTVDTITPGVNLTNPRNNSFNVLPVDFNWTVTDNFDQSLLCNLTIDNIVNTSNIISLNGTITNKSMGKLSQGEHNWSVRCWDSAGNINTSETYNFAINVAPTIKNADIITKRGEVYSDLKGYCNATDETDDAEIQKFEYRWYNNSVVYVNGTAFKDGSISVGEDHTCGIRASDSRVLCWGAGISGKLGDGDTSSHNVGIPNLTLDTSAYLSTSVGEYHTCGIRANDSRVLCWGNNDYGQLGNGSSGGNSSVPILIEDTGAYLSISVGYDHTCGIRANDSRVLCWGMGTGGLLGDGNISDHYVITPNLTKDSSPYLSVSAGEIHTCGVRANDSRVLCWGYGFEGSLGDGTGSFHMVATPNLTMDSSAYFSVSVGQMHTCGIRANDSRVLCWGMGEFGRLGDGNINSHPVGIPNLTMDSSAYFSVSVGQMHTCGIRANDSRVLCWGNGANGKIGDGNTSFHFVAIPNATKDTSAYLSISVGYDYTCGIRANDSRVLCWGYGYKGSLGDNNTGGHPVGIPNLTKDTSAYSSFFANNQSNFVSLIDKQFLFADDSWILSCRAYDGHSWSEWLNSSVLELKEHPPNITLNYPPNETITGSKKIELNVSIFDIDGDPMIVKIFGWRPEDITSSKTDGLVSLYLFNNYSSFGENETFIYDFSGNGNHARGGDNPGESLVVNPSFEIGNYPWNWTSINLNGGSTTYNRVTPGKDDTTYSARLTINSVGSTKNIQFYQNKIPLKSDTEYTLRFYAGSNTGRNLNVLVQRHDSPYTVYFNRNDVNIPQVSSYNPNNMGEFIYTFTTPPGIDGLDIRLTFVLNVALAGDIYYFDEVKIYEAGDTDYPIWRSDGKFEGAYEFDGDDDWIDVTPSTGPIFNEVNYSISFWANANEGKGVIYADSNSSGNNFPLFYIYDSNKKCKFYIRNDASSTPLMESFSNRDCFNGTWHHIVWTDGNGTGKLYIDGVEDPNSEDGDFNYNRVGKFSLDTSSIGLLNRKPPYELTNDFKGMVDELSLWDRVLTEEEIDELYEGSLKKFEEKLIYQGENFPNGDVLYNLTSMPLSSQTNMNLLMHFDKDEEVGESDTFVYDWTGKENDGSCSGSSCPYFNFSEGVFAGSANFYGEGDYIGGIKNSTINRLEGSISVWAYPTNLTDPKILLWAGASNGDGFSSPGGPPEFHLGTQHFNKDLNQTGFTFFYGGEEDGVASLIEGTNYTYVYSGKLQENKWYNVVVTWDLLGENKTKMYLDGVLVDTDDVAGDDIPYNSLWQDEVYIGRPGVTEKPRNWTGKIDELAIFNTALDAEEIKELHKLQYGKYYWYGEVSDGIFTNVSDTWWFEIMNIAPSINLNFPQNESVIATKETTLNATIFDQGEDPMIVKIFGLDAEIYDGTLDEGLVLLMHMNNDSNYGENNTWVYDFSGTENDGECYGNNCPKWNSSGRFDGAFNFDGDADYVYVPSDSSTDVFYNGGGTVSAWIYPTGYDLDDALDGSYIISKRDGNAGYWIFWVKNYSAGNDVNTLSFSVGAAGTPYWNSEQNVIELNKWQHVAVVYNASSYTNDPIFYVNGKVVGIEDDHQGTSTPYSDNNAPIIIGGRVTGLEPWERDFKGTIDEVGIWNRTLTAQEIKGLYEKSNWKYIYSGENLQNGDIIVNLTSWPLSVQKDMVLLMHMDNDSSVGERDDLVYDWSGLGNNGSCSGTNCPEFNFSGGRFGGGFKFDGKEDYLNLSSKTSIDNLDPMTFSAWIYPNDWGENRYGRIFGKTAGNGDLTNSLYFDDDTGDEESIRFYRDRPTDTILQTSKGNIELKKWQHLVLVFDSEKSVAKIYINGEEADYSINQIGSGAVVADQSYDLLIGNRGNLDRSFNGTMDEVAIWNRSLTAQEVKEIYQLQNGKYYWYGEVSDGILTNVSDTWWFEIVDSSPVINDVQTSREIQGYGLPINVTANITCDWNVSSAWLEVIDPQGTSANFSMENVSDIYYYNYIGWKNGTHTFTIYANDSEFGSISSASGSFEYFANLTIQIRTLKDVYWIDDIVNLTDPPELDLRDLIDSPLITDAYVQPNDVKPGDKMQVYADVEDESGVRKVTAEMPYEGGLDILNLEIIEGNKQKGKWYSTWNVHDTLEKEYITSIKAENEIGETSEKEIAWMDSNWWNYDWGLRKEITIDSNYVAGNLNNFPIFVSLKYSDLTDSAQPDGDDIVFVNISGNKLDHEIEYFNKTTGELATWVRIPFLSGSSNTTIYMYYGNNYSENQQNKTGVWDSNFIGVYHLSETSGEFKDSTRYGNNGTDSVSATGKTGKVGPGQEWDGVNDYVNLYNTLADDIDALKGTISAWVYRNELDPGENNPVLDIFAGTAENEILLFYNNLNPNDYWTIKHCGSGTCRSANSVLINDIPQNTWGYLTGTWTSVAYNGKYGWMYTNATFNGSMAGTVYGFNAGITSIKMGSNQAGSRNWNGYLDEVRVSKVARTHEWIATEYNNQNNVSRFMKIGASETILRYSEFRGIGETTNLDEIGFEDEEVNLTLENLYGKISWIEEVSLNKTYDLDAVIEISQGSVSVDPSVYPSINKTINITMKNLQLGYPKILKDGVECKECTILKWDTNLGYLVFNTTGFSEYTAEEANQSKIQNNGTTNTSIYILLQVEYWNSTGLKWENSGVVYNDSAPHSLNTSSLIKFDSLFNGKWNTTANATYGSGKYRVYVAAQDPKGNVLENYDGSLLETYYNFSVVFTDPPQIIKVWNETIEDNTALGISFEGPRTGPSSTEVEVKFTVQDSNGWEDINVSSANMNFTMAGEEFRESHTCSIIEFWEEYANVTCNVTMWWWDGPTTPSEGYNITIYIEDYSNEGVLNDSASFGVGPKIDFEISISGEEETPAFSFADVQVGATDIEAENNPLLMNNTGNVDATRIEVNSTNLTGMENSNYQIGADNFWMSVLNDCSGNQMQEANYVTISDAVLFSGNYTKNDETAQEELSLCLKTVPTGLPSQIYSTDNPWEINIFAFISPFLKLLVVSVIRKKKKVEEDRLVGALDLLLDELKEKYSLNKEEVTKLMVDRLKKKHGINRKELLESIGARESFEIPITIFSKEVGGLEAVVRYMKENLNMTYREIARELGRSEKTIWIAYKKAVEKQPTPKEIVQSEITLKPMVFKNPELTILESIVIHLKNKGMKYSEIGELIDRDQRNVWTIYSRAMKKIGEESKE